MKMETIRQKAERLAIQKYPIQIGVSKTGGKERVSELRQAYISGFTDFEKLRDIKWWEYHGKTGKARKEKWIQYCWGESGKKQIAESYHSPY